MDTEFKISAVIPTHNRATLVIRAITSVLRQTSPVHEIVVVDDGSIDKTEQILAQYLNSVGKTNLLIRYFYQPQQGAAVARNNGVAQATGNWIAFLDSDDIWRPEKLHWQIKALRECDGCQACVTDAKYTNNPFLTKSAFAEVDCHFDSVTGVIPGYTRRITSRKFHGAHLPTLLVSRELFLSLGGFPAAFPVNEDTDFFFRLAQFAKVCYVNIPLIEVDRSPSRVAGLTDLRKKETYRLQMAQLMYEKWLREYRGPDPAIPKAIRRRLRDIHVGWASCQLIEGNTLQALHSVSTALQYSYSLKAALKWISIRFTPELTKNKLLRRRETAPPPLL
jgi:glycosyltransferase involved in cell wall biosynthesis